MNEEKIATPYIESRLRHNILKMPPETYAASGIVIPDSQISQIAT